MTGRDFTLRSSQEDLRPMPSSGIGRRVQRFLGLDEAIGRAANKAADQAVAKALGQLEQNFRHRHLELKASIEEMRAATEATTQAAEQSRDAVHAMHAALDARGASYASATDEHLTEHVSAQSEAVKARVEALLSDQLAYMCDTTAKLIAAGQTMLLEQIHGQLSHVDTHFSAHLARELSLQLEQIHGQLSHVDAHLSAHLAKELSLQLGKSGSVERGGNDQALLQRRLMTLGRLLEPSSAKGVPKLRLGHSGDGGYVMLDDFRDVEFALSLGVGAEMTWDIAMADRGILVHQFDYTIDAPPEMHERIHFHRSRIVPVQEGADHSLSSAQRLGNERSCIVKMDIEGDEWSVLDAAGEHDFDRVLQLVVEMHDFERVGDDEWFARAERVLRRLASTFRVVHVHANNNGLFRVRGNVAFPDIVEVTFANRRHYDFESLAETFPTALDAPNRDDLPDIILGTFQF